MLLRKQIVVHHYWTSRLQNLRHFETEPANTGGLLGQYHKESHLFQFMQHKTAICVVSTTWGSRRLVLSLLTEKPSCRCFVLHVDPVVITVPSHWFKSFSRLGPLCVGHVVRVLAWILSGYSPKVQSLVF